MQANSFMVTPESVVVLIHRKDLHSATEALFDLSQNADYFGLSKHFILKTIAALKNNNWTELSKSFRDREFIGKNGNFLLIGPYTVKRLGAEITEITAICGHVISFPQVKGLDSKLKKMFGLLNERAPEIIPVELVAATDLIGNEHGEAFIVQDGWGFIDSAKGPPLNVIAEQRRRLTGSGFKCLRQIFEPQTAELLIGFLEDLEDCKQTQHLEYHYHDAGHVAGHGLQRKLTNNLLPTLWTKAVEEWRADGVEFALAAESGSSVETARIIASNLCVRFGIDAHRAGGVESDADVNAVVIMLDRLLNGGGMKLDPDGKLALAEPTPVGLIQALQQQAQDSVRLTRKELSTPETAIGDLYQQISVNPESFQIFQENVVKPCSGNYLYLR